MKFRKKPVVIEAWTAKEISSAMSKDWNLGFVPKLIIEAYGKGGWVFLTSGEISIPTPLGTMIASPEDYIIQGVDGEFYPCKADVFEKKYEKVD